MEEPMEARVRFLAGWAAAAVFVGVLIWGVVVLGLVTRNFGEYCEDFNICDEGEPVITTIQAILGLTGIFAAIWLGIGLARYARGKGPPERLIRPGVLVVVFFVVWLVASADLR
jgi:ABC-type Na+ efflux pump permease subunit